MNSKLINRFNQILAFIILFLLIIMPLCLILLKGFVPEGGQTFFDHLKKLGQPYH